MNTRSIFLLVISTASLLTSYAQSSPATTAAVAPATTAAVAPAPALALAPAPAPAVAPVRILAFYNPQEDPSHVAFAESAVSFFSGFNGSRNLSFESTTDPAAMDKEGLKDVDVIMMLNHVPLDKKQRKVFEEYMENGGRWMGFHKSALYREGEWPWFTRFLGGVVFADYNWPPLPTPIQIEDPLHPVCRGVPERFTAPANEWYRFSPGLRENPAVQVLASVAAESFPLGISRVFVSEDLPIAWANRQYRMVYLNMGHGSNGFSDASQNLLFTNALQWLLATGMPVEEKVAVAYVTSWKAAIPDPAFVTHINYAFGHVNETFDGVIVDNPDRLRQIVALKKQKTSLKVLLSIGGWGSGRFSEMVASETYRASFACGCGRVVKEFGLDGIDIDWEYPTNQGPGISHAPEDTRNFTFLMRDIRKQLPNGMLLTLASAASGKFIDFKAITGYVDFVNIMTYDISLPPFHHSGLYPSSMTGNLSCYESVLAHVRAGFPLDRLVLGIPFYGKTSPDFPQGMGSYGKLIQLEEFEKCWDDIAKGPYLKDSNGKIVCTYDNPRSIGYKSRFINDYGMKGAMYWEYEGDDREGSLRKAVFEGVFEGVFEAE